MEQFRVLLPKNTSALKEDISALLEKKMDLDPTTYQIGKTKVHHLTFVIAPELYSFIPCIHLLLFPFCACTFWCVLPVQVFLKELERQKLQDTLHKDVMRKIIFLQRWFRARLQRKEFLDMRRAAILIQVNTNATLIFEAVMSVY